MRAKKRFLKCLEKAKTLVSDNDSFLIDNLNSLIEYTKNKIEEEKSWSETEKIQISKDIKKIMDSDLFMDTKDIIVYVENDLSFTVETFHPINDPSNELNHWNKVIVYSGTDQREMDKIILNEVYYSLFSFISIQSRKCLCEPYEYNLHLENDENEKIVNVIKSERNHYLQIPQSEKFISFQGEYSFIDNLKDYGWVYQGAVKVNRMDYQTNKLLQLSNDVNKVFDYNENEK